MDSPMHKTDFPSFVNRFSAANNLNNSQKSDAEKVAKDFEAFFLYLLLKEMKKTVNFSKKSFAENSYMDILYERVAEYVSHRGTGIKDLLLRNLSKGQAKELKQNADKQGKGVIIYEDK